jgi:hypothetical protein
VQADRLSLAIATLVYHAQQYGSLGSQVPSMVDLNMTMNMSTDYSGCANSASAGRCGPHGWNSATAGYYRFASPVVTQDVLLAPSGNEIIMSCGADAKAFVLEKAQGDGTVSKLAVGCSTGAEATTGQPPTYPAVVQAGAIQRLRLGLRQKNFSSPSAGSPFAKLNVQLPPAMANLSAAMQLFARVQNQWMSWVFGNNPASIPALHEMGWFSWIQQMFDVGSASHGALKKQMGWFGQSAVNASGYVYPRWNSGGYYQVQWGPLADQQPHFIIAMQAAAAISGDKAWLTEVEPAVDAAARYMLLRGLNSSRHTTPNPIPGVPAPGVFTTISSGLGDGGTHCTNWYDIVGFGGADSYVSVYSVLAMRAMAEIKDFLGKPVEAAEYRRIERVATEAFSEAFWSEERGFFADWVDVNGTARHYMYADTQHLAVAYGVANASQARRIMALIDQRYEDICGNFSISRDDIWATPSNFFPIPATAKGDTTAGHWGTPSAAGSAWGSMPSYEIGGSFFHSVGLEALARASWPGGSGKDALVIYERFMRRGFAQNRGWAQQLFWGSETGKRPEELVGSDPLNNALLATWGSLQAMFGVRISLAEVRLTGAATPPELEGAQWTFAWRGESTCVQASGGKAHLC